MSDLTRDDVARLAALARITLTPEELDRLAGQLGTIVKSVGAVAGAVAEDTPATSHPIPLENVFRADEVTASLANADALAAAPAREGGQFRVPQILGEEP
jgi:aspartyl-tRNA(Asn)/glutamyl-tRNA(Gln) amidotransferase subunit C